MMETQIQRIEKRPRLKAAVKTEAVFSTDKAKAEVLGFTSQKKKV